MRRQINGDYSPRPRQHRDRAKDRGAEEASWPATKSLPGIFNRKSDRGGMKHNISLASMKTLIIYQLVGGRHKLTMKYYADLEEVKGEEGAVSS